MATSAFRGREELGYLGGERESLFYDIKCVKWGKNKYVCHLLSRLQTRMLPAEDEKGGQSSNAPIEGEEGEQTHSFQTKSVKWGKTK